MNSIRILFVLMVLACSYHTNAQQKTIKAPYKIDSTIKNDIEQKIKILEGLTIGSMVMDVKMYENDVLTADTYSEGRSIDECLISSSLDGDTVHLTGFVGMFSGFGFQLSLTKNASKLEHILKAETEMYKLSKKDALMLGISVPCVSSQITLIKQPNFKSGDVIEGKIELLSKEYYEVINGEEKKIKMQLTAYFRTEPLHSSVK